MFLTALRAIKNDIDPNGRQDMTSFAVNQPQLTLYVVELDLLSFLYFHAG